MIVSLPASLPGIIESTLAHNEHIECKNATIICNDKGDITGWFDNNKLINIVLNNEKCENDIE